MIGMHTVEGGMHTMEGGIHTEQNAHSTERHTHTVEWHAYRDSALTEGVLQLAFEYETADFGR